MIESDELTSAFQKTIRTLLDEAMARGLTLKQIEIAMNVCPGYLSGLRYDRLPTIENFLVLMELCSYDLIIRKRPWNKNSLRNQKK